MAKKAIKIVLITGFLLWFAQNSFAQITYNPPVPNVEQEVTFTWTTGPLYDNKWDFGDGTTATGGNTITHTYSAPGTYTVSVEDYYGYDSDETTITIVENRRIEHTPADIKIGTEVTFRALNFLSSSVRWDFGDTTTVMGTTVQTHTYIEPGNYVVEARDLGGKSIVSITKSVTVGEAQITYDPAVPNVEQEVTFNWITGAPKPAPRLLQVNLTWNFGDGTTATGGYSITHTYLAPGTYTVTATDPYGYSPSTTITIVEKRRIEHTPENIKVGTEVTFRAINFLSSSVKWNFGDKTTVMGTTVQTHIYRKLGDYVVKARDLGGNSIVAITKSITVGGKMPFISYSPANPQPGQPITFTARHFISKTLIRWDFGDGTIIDDTTPPQITHTYTSPGTYSVKAYDHGEVIVTASIKIKITIQAFITYSPDHPRVGKKVTFTARKFLSKTLIRWDFGDGTVIDDTTPPQITHIYDSPGIYKVTAYDNAETILTASVRVRVLPQPFISYSPANPQIRERITFTAHHFLSETLIRWDFGDGTIRNDRTPPSIKHAYTQPGTYLVRAYDNGGTRVTASIRVQVLSLAYISYSPADPRPGETITFTANNFLSKTLIRWDFGDGTITNDSTPPSITHAYAQSGTYLVRAYDNGGQTVTASTSITVLPERLITYTPLQPKMGEEVTFRTINFSSQLIKWDFGDGTIIQQGTSTVTHTYQKEGTYTVKAYDFRQNLEIPVSISITISAPVGPRAPFSISFIQLRFEDGKSYKVVPKDFEPLVAYADIKYEGTGTLYAQWLVDGRPFRLISKSLPYAEGIILDSGQIPGLPTLVPGIHEVTLDIIQPSGEYSIPVIRYFITLEKIDKEKINLFLSKALNLEGLETPIGIDTIEAPPNAYFLFTGKVKNESQAFIPFSLLRIYLENELVDQKLIKDLRPNEEIEFETSLFNPSSEPKKIYLILYNISQEPSDLISIKSINIISKKD